MKTIGQILKDARVSKKYSLSRVEEETKIKKSFLLSIENEKWEALPALATVLGFVKSMAGFLDVDEKMAVAVLKRDYPPKKLNIVPKPDVGGKFSWSPKLTFTVGIIAFLLLIFGYLGFQYIRFISPPGLAVESPKDGQEVTNGSVLVFGSTDTDAKITVENQPVLVGDDGKFSVSISVVPETKEITVKAISRSGKENVIRRTIRVE